MSTALEDQLVGVASVSMALDDQDPSVPEIIRGTGHLPEMRVDPISLFHRVREECGDVGRFRLADKDVVHLVLHPGHTRRAVTRPRSPTPAWNCPTRR